MNCSFVFILCDKSYAGIKLYSLFPLWGFIRYAQNQKFSMVSARAGASTVVGMCSGILTKMYGLLTDKIV